MVFNIGILLMEIYGFSKCDLVLMYGFLFFFFIFKVCGLYYIWKIFVF